MHYDYYINGVIDNKKYATEKEFSEAFLKWVENEGGMFGGAVGHVDDLNSLSFLHKKHQDMLYELYVHLKIENKGSLIDFLGNIVEEYYKSSKELASKPKSDLELVKEQLDEVQTSLKATRTDIKDLKSYNENFSRLLVDSLKKDTGNE